MIPVITIIIPTYNHSSSITKAVESVLHQDKENWRLIIVDDGSTDRTKDILSPYFTNPKVSYYYKENGGVSSARNLGLKNCETEYVVFLDADDLFSHNLISTLNACEFYKYDLITWRATKEYVDKKSVWKPQRLGGLYNNWKVSFLAGTICYNYKSIMEAGGFDEGISFGENYELGIRISQRNHKLKVLEANLLFIQSSKKRSSNSLHNRIVSGLHQYKKHKSLYKSLPKEDSKINYILGYLQHKNSNKTEALKYYISSWKANRYNYKALLRIIQLKFLSNI